MVCYNCIAETNAQEVLGDLNEDWVDALLGCIL